MLALLNRYKNIWGSVILLTLPLFFLYISGKRENHSSFLDQLLVGITSPLLRVSSTMSEGINALWSHYVALTNLAQDNLTLRKQIARLTMENIHLNTLAREVYTLRRGMGYINTYNSAYPERKLIFARVIGKDISPYYKVVRIVIDKGEESAITSGMPVITYKGAVGRIERVGMGYANVLLLSDSRSRISVKNARTELTGLLQGHTDADTYTCIFRFLHPRDDLQLKDLLVTTGLDRVFPSDIPVGTIASIKRKQSGSYYELQVIPAVNLSTVSEVFVIVDKPSEDQ